MNLQSLRQQAISHSLFPPADLKSALDRLQFVQADPIRSPARAQDLILRLRVQDYRAGDLERLYPILDLEEDVLYAYGFVTRNLWQSLHPRTQIAELPEFEQRILAKVVEAGQMHPRELEAHFGRAPVINAWGGQSQATTRALEHLHHRGLLRVVRRDKGIRVYGARIPLPETVELTELSERLRKLALVTARILAPVTEKCLSQALALVRRSLSSQITTRTVTAQLLHSGELEKQTIDGISYLFPPLNPAPDDPPRTVRLLAPFDPLVWDRSRFEHFWGWAYRFEAYTPAAKRVRGYYALPLLWHDSMIGWANLRVQNNSLQVELGFSEKEPIDANFRRELEQEIERMKIFLNVSDTASLLCGNDPVG